jgi:hypothetical protein
MFLKSDGKRNCSVSVALSLISFGFLNYVMRMRKAGRIPSNDWSRSAPATPVKRTCHKTNAPQTDTQRERRVAGKREREREWSVGK